MNLRQIEVFRAVMITGSITAAADLLCVTPPGVSRMIKHVQITLGITLFERLGGRIVPTSDAKKLYREVERTYIGVEHIQRFAKTLRLGFGEVLRVVCSPNVSLRTVPTAICVLQKKFPTLIVHLEVLPFQHLIESILMRQSDIGVGISRPDHPSLVMESLGTVSLVAAIPMRHPLAAREYINIADLHGEPFIRFNEHTTQGSTINSLLNSKGIIPQTKVVVRIARAASALVEAGIGIALLDELTAASGDFQKTILRRVVTDVTYPLFVAWHKEAPLSDLAQEFKKILGMELQSRDVGIISQFKTQVPQVANFVNPNPN